MIFICLRRYKNNSLSATGFVRIVSPGYDYRHLLPKKVLHSSLHRLFGLLVGLYRW
jgi:hypothetical protein